MKKTLLSLVLSAATVLNLAAAPDNLSDRLFRHGTKTTESYVSYDGNLKPAGTNEIVTLRGSQKLNFPDYKIDVSAQEVNNLTENTVSKDLMFEVYNSKTKATIIERDSSSKPEIIKLDHTFESGDQLVAEIRHRPNNELYVSCDLYDSKGKVIRETKTNRPLSFSVYTEDFNKLTRILIHKKTRPMVQFGDRLYENMVYALNGGNDPKLPCETLIKALGRIEPLLPAIKAGNSNIEKALSGLGNEYIKLADKENKIAKK